MKRLAIILSKNLEKQGVIHSSEMEICRYGLEMLISSTFTSLSILIIASILDSLGSGLLYLFISIPLRVTAGGYHADTYGKCFFISNALYILLSFLVKLCQTSNIPLFLWLVALYFSSLYIHRKSPVLNIHQPLSEADKKANKERVTIILILDNIVISLLALVNISTKAVQISILSILLVALLIIPTQKGGETE